MLHEQYSSKGSINELTIAAATALVVVIAVEEEVGIIWLSSLPIPEMFQWLNLQWLFYCTLFNKAACKNM